MVDNGEYGLIHSLDPFFRWSQMQGSGEGIVVEVKNSERIQPRIENEFDERRAAGVRLQRPAPPSCASDTQPGDLPLERCSRERSRALITGC